MSICRVAAAGIATLVMTPAAQAAVILNGTTTTNATGLASVPLGAEFPAFARFRVRVETSAAALARFSITTFEDITTRSGPVRPDRFVTYGSAGIGGTPTPTTFAFGYRTLYVSAGPNFARYLHAVSFDSALLSLTSAPTSSLSYRLVFNPVPEPATWALFIVGFAGIGSALRRRSAVARQARGQRAAPAA